jgi:hypothetical protein
VGCVINRNFLEFKSKRHFQLVIRLKIYILFIFVLTTSCSDNGSKHFSLTVKHYAAAAGVTIIYSINNIRLQVDTNCDLVDCKEATVYKRVFSKAESDSIIASLKLLRLDTLNSSYKYQGYYNDGFYTEIRLRNGLFSSHSSTFNNVSTRTADSLNVMIDKLVTKPEFRLATWGQKE